MVKAKDADSGPLPTIAAFTVGLSGLMHTLLGAQFMAFWWLTGVQWVAVSAILVAGVLGLYLAYRLMQASATAAVAATVLSPAMGLLSVSFGIYAVINGSFALYMLFAPPAAVLATLMAPLAIGPCRRAAKAQNELDAQHRGGPLAGMFE